MDNRQRTTMEEKNSMNETVAGTAISLSQTQTCVNNKYDKSRHQTSSMMMRPISAQPFIKAKGYKINNTLEGKTRLITDDEQRIHTVNSEEFAVNQSNSTKADAYIRLASRTKQIFENNPIGPERRTYNVRPATGGNYNYYNYNQGQQQQIMVENARGSYVHTQFQERQPSYFSITSNNLAGVSGGFGIGPFGSSMRTSLLTINQQKQSIPQNMFESKKVHQIQQAQLLSAKEKSDLLMDLNMQLKELQVLNKRYLEHFDVKRLSQNPVSNQQNHFQKADPVESGMSSFKNSLINTKYSEPVNKNIFPLQVLDLQDLFFQCAINAIRMRTKRNNQSASSSGIRLNSGHGPFSLRNADSIAASGLQNQVSVDNKINSLIKMVTNRHTLQVLYDVMYKFKKVQGNPIFEGKGCLSEDFVKGIQQICTSGIDSTVSVGGASPTKRKKITLRANHTFSNRNKVRHSRNIDFTHTTDFNVLSNLTLDKTNNYSEIYQTIPMDLQSKLHVSAAMLSRDQARKLALQKLNKKQKLDLKKLRKQVVQMQNKNGQLNNNQFNVIVNVNGEIVQKQQHFPNSSLLIDAMMPSEFNYAAAATDPASSKTPKTIQNESLARNASDISHAQVIVLSSQKQSTVVNNFKAENSSKCTNVMNQFVSNTGNIGQQIDESSHPVQNTDEATALIDNFLITKDSATQPNQVTLQDTFPVSKMMSLSNDKLQILNGGQGTPNCQQNDRLAQITNDRDSLNLGIGNSGLEQSKDQQRQAVSVTEHRNNQVQTAYLISSGIGTVNRGSVVHRDASDIQNQTDIDGLGINEPAPQEITLQARLINENTDVRGVMDINGSNRKVFENKQDQIEDIQAIKPIEVQINNNNVVESRLKHANKSSNFGGYIRSKGSIIVSDSQHYIDKQTSNDRTNLVSKVTVRPASSSLKNNTKKSIKKSQNSDLQFKGNKMSSDPMVVTELALKQNIENSRQRQQKILNSMSVKIDGNQISTSAIVNDPQISQIKQQQLQTYGRTKQFSGQVVGCRPRSLKSSMEYDSRMQKNQGSIRLQNYNRQAKLQSATLQITNSRKDGHQVVESRNSKMSVDVEVNNSSSLNDNNTKAKRRSIQLNITNMNRRIQKLNKAEAKFQLHGKNKVDQFGNDSASNNSLDEEIDSNGQQEVNITRQISPNCDNEIVFSGDGPASLGAVNQIKTDSVKMGSVVQGQEVGGRIQSMFQSQNNYVLPNLNQQSDQYQTNANNNRLNDDLANLELGQMNQQILNKRLLQNDMLSHAKNPSVFVSRTKFANLEECPYLDSGRLNSNQKRDHNSSGNNNLDDSKEHTDQRNRTQDQSEFGDTKEGNQPSHQLQQSMRQQPQLLAPTMAPISSVHISTTNAGLQVGPDYPLATTDLVSYFSGINNKQMLYRNMNNPFASGPQESFGKVSSNQGPRQYQSSNFFTLNSVSVKNVDQAIGNQQQQYQNGNQQIWGNSSNPWQALNLHPPEQPAPPITTLYSAPLASQYISNLPSTNNATVSQKQQPHAQPLMPASSFPMPVPADTIYLVHNFDSQRAENGPKELYQQQFQQPNMLINQRQQQNNPLQATIISTGNLLDIQSNNFRVPTPTMARKKKKVQAKTKGKGGARGPNERKIDMLDILKSLV